jgi:GT2 family glycosyltransferase
MSSSLSSVQNGCIDSLTYCGSMEGWLAAGWIDLTWDDQDIPPQCLLEFAGGDVQAEGIACTFPRADVRKMGIGLLLFVPGAPGRAAELQDVILTQFGRSFRLTPSEPLDTPGEAEAMARVKSLANTAPRTARRAQLLRLLNRPTFSGQDTVETLQQPIFLELDGAYLCPPDGLLLRGWMIDPFDSLSVLRVRCGAEARTIDPRRWVPIARPDVREGFSAQFGGLQDQCGFLVFVPNIFTPGEPVYFELQTRLGEVVFKRIPAIRSTGVDTIKDTLSHLELRYDDLETGYDNVLGPAVEAMNRFRLREPVGYHEMSFGPVPEHPRCSIIVPLYGRIDFMELQLAFFSRSLSRDHEIIYVLDDPRQMRATAALANSCLERFLHPFRLVTLSGNVGYAPANNVGLKLARGEYVCFLNSDVFPKTNDWLEYMLQTAASSDRFGVVGALLVFEDETVQHEGVAYERLPEFANWQFSLHPRKGRFPVIDEPVREVEAVTGACLLMPMRLAREVGGFDEGYVIGDFEDVDLCKKAQERGFTCVVDRRAQLYHLERQSQGEQQTSWRLNLTLYNAWRFQNRWVRPGAPGSGWSLADSAGSTEQVA